MHTKFCQENVKRYNLEDVDVDGRMILTQVVKKQDERVHSRFIWTQDRDLWQAGACGCGNESSDSIKGKEFLDLLSVCQVQRRSVFKLFYEVWQYQCSHGQPSLCHLVDLGCYVVAKYRYANFCFIFMLNTAFFHLSHF